ASELVGDPRSPARIGPVVEGKGNSPRGSDVSGLQSAGAPGEYRPIVRKRPASSRDGRCAAAGRPGGDALDSEQRQQRPEEQPEDDPAGNGPRRSAHVSPSWAAVEAGAVAVRPSSPGRAKPGL